MSAYETLELTVKDRVGFVTINNPPVNVMTPKLYHELVAVTEQLETDERLKVVVFQSADPDFFIAHFDVNAILTFPAEGPPRRQRHCRHSIKCASGYEPCRRLPW